MKAVYSQVLCVFLALGMAGTTEASSEKSDTKRSETIEKPASDTPLLPFLFEAQTVRVVGITEGGTARFTKEGRIQEVRRDGLLLQLGTSRNPHSVRAYSPGETQQTVEAQTFEVKFSEIERLELREQNGSYIGPGVLIGLVAGIAVGVSAQSDSNHPAAPGVNASVVVMSTLLGTVVGGFIGSNIPKYEWMTVPAVYYSGSESPHVDPSPLEPDDH